VRKHMRLYTSSQIATLTGLARVTINKYAASGRVGQKVGRDWVFTEEDLSTVLLQSETNGTVRENEGTATQ
jgi:hypothetical protein